MASVNNSAEEYNIEVKVVVSNNDTDINRIRRQINKLLKDASKGFAPEIPKVSVSNTKSSQGSLRRSVNTLFKDSFKETPPTISSVIVKKLDATDAIKKLKKEVGSLANGFGANGFEIKFGKNNIEFTNAIDKNVTALDSLKKKLNQVNSLTTNVKTAKLYQSNEVELLKEYQDIQQEINEAKRNGLSFDERGIQQYQALVDKVNAYYDKVVSISEAEQNRVAQVSTESKQLSELRSTYTKITGSMESSTLQVGEMSKRLGLSEEGATQLLTKVQSIDQELSSGNTSIERQVALYTELKQLYTEVTANSKEYQDKKAASAVAETQQINTLKKAYNTITGSMNSSSLKVGEMSKRLGVTRSGAEQLLNKVKAIDEEMSSGNVSTERQVELLTDLKQTYTNIVDESKDYKRTMDSMSSKTEAMVKKLDVGGSISKKVSSLEGRIGSGDYNTVTTQLQTLCAKAKVLEGNLKQANQPVEQLETEFNKLKDLVNGFSSAIDQTKKHMQDSKSFRSAQVGFAGLQANAEAYYTRVKDIVAKSPTMMSSLDSFMTSLRSGTSVDYSSLKQQFREIQIQIDKAGLSTKSFGDKLKDVALHKTRMLLLGTATTFLYTTMNKVLESVKSVDSAMTQLKIVTGESDNALSNYFTKAAEAAKKLGVSITDIISSTETYARLGYSLQDSLKLSKSSNLLANVGAINIDEATSGMTSILKAYKKDASDSENITDILINVGQKYAISASELATALERGGASLQASNNTLEESVALAAAGNAAVQNAETVGNALKTTALRIRGAKAELEEMGEDTDGLCKSSSKLREELMRLSGVDIMKNDKTFKSTYQILLEISNVWDKLSDINQAAVLEDIAGKRNASVIKSVITNVDDLKNSYQTALSSDGVSEEANEDYLDSINGKIGQVKASFEQLSNEVLSSDLVKFGLDILNTVMSINDALVGSIGSVFTLITYAGFATLLGIFKNIKTNAVGVQTALNSLGTTDGDKGLSVFIDQVSMLDKRQRSAALSASGLTKEQKKYVKSMLDVYDDTNNLTKSQVKNALAVEGMTDAEEELIVAKLSSAEATEMENSSLKLYNVTKLKEIIQNSNLSAEKQAEIIARLENKGTIEAENASLKTQLILMAKNPLTWVSLAVSGFLSLISVISSTTKSAEELHEEAGQIKEDFESASEKTTQNLKTLQSKNGQGQSLTEEFSELCNGVDEYGNRISLTNEQYERYKEICDTIVNINPDIAKGYKSNTEAIGNNANVLEDLIRLQEIQAKNAAKNATSGDNWDTLVDDATAQYKDAKEKIDEAIRISAGDINYEGTSPIKHSIGAFDLLDFLEEQGFDHYDGKLSDLLIDNYDKLKSNFDHYNDEWSDYVTSQISSGNWSSAYKNKFKEYFKEIIDGYGEVENNLETAEEGMRNTFKTVAQSTDEYYDDIDASSRKFITKWIDNSDDFKVSSDDEGAINAAKDKIKKIIDKLASTDYSAEFEGKTLFGQDFIKKLFSLDTSKLDLTQYEKQAKELLNHIYRMLNPKDKNVTDDDVINFGLNIGIDLDHDSEKNLDNQLSKVSNTLYKRLQEGTFSIPASIDVDESSVDGIKEWLSSLSVDDINNLLAIDANTYDSWYELENAINKGNNSVASITAAEKRYKEALDTISKDPTSEEKINELNAAAVDYANSTAKSTSEIATKLSEINDHIDKFQNAYKVGYSAISDYQQSGVLSVDNLQEILSLDEKYINLLIDENGQLNLNSDAYAKLTQSQLDNLKIQQAMQIIDTVSNLKGQALAAYSASEAYTKAGQSAEDFVMATLQAKVSTGEMTKEQANIAFESINKRFMLINSVSEGLSKNTQVSMGAASATDALNSSTNASKSALEKQKSGLEANKKALEAEKDALEQTQKALERKKQALEDSKSDYTDAYDNVKNLLDITKKYIKQQKEDEKQALEDKKKNLDDIIDKRKKDLDAQKDELDFQKKLNEYNKSIVQNQIKVAASSLDTTSSGQSINRTAEYDLKESKKDLDDYLVEHNLDSKKDALDNQKDRIDKYYDKKTKVIEKYLQNEKKLNKDAYKILDGFSKSSYNKLKKYATDYTDTTAAEFNKMWTSAKASNRAYNKVGRTTKSLLSALKGKILNCESAIKATDKQINKVKNQIDDKSNGITAIGNKISDLSSKISDANNKTKNSKSSIVNGVVKPTKEAISLADTLLKKWKTILNITDEPQKKYTFKFNGKVYKVKAKNANAAANAIYSAFQKQNNEAISLDKDYIRAKITNQKPWKFKFNGATYQSYKSDKDVAATEIYKKVTSNPSIRNANINVDLDYIKKKIKRYATGAKNTSNALSITDEKGYEAKFPKLSNGRYTLLPEKSQVFTKAMTDALWNFSSNPKSFLSKELSTNISTNNVSNNRNISVNIPINITGDATQSTVNALKQQADKISRMAVDRMYREVLTNI